MTTLTYQKYGSRLNLALILALMTLSWNLGVNKLSVWLLTYFYTSVITYYLVNNYNGKLEQMVRILSASYDCIVEKSRKSELDNLSNILSCNSLDLDS